jgi:hypothetical protein
MSKGVLCLAIMLSVASDLVLVRAASCSSYASIDASCVNAAGCKWCTYPFTANANTGTCTNSYMACPSAYPQAVTNPCTGSTTLMTCVGNRVCGWCGPSSTCMYVGLSGAPPAQCPPITVSTCYANKDRSSCYNAPYLCYWCPNSNECYPSSTACTNYQTSACDNVHEQHMCDVSAVHWYDTGKCGWCGNYLGTGLGSCLYSTSGSPSECFVTEKSGLSSGAFIAIIVVSLLIVLLAIGAVVYCWRKRRASQRNEDNNIIIMAQHQVYS